LYACQIACLTNHWYIICVHIFFNKSRSLFISVNWWYEQQNYNGINKHDSVRTNVKCLISLWWGCAWFYIYLSSTEVHKKCISCIKNIWNNLFACLSIKQEHCYYWEHSNKKIDATYNIIDINSKYVSFLSYVFDTNDMKNKFNIAGLKHW
jgi:hypothetical protein